MGGEVDSVDAGDSDVAESLGSEKMTASSEDNIAGNHLPAEASSGFSVENSVRASIHTTTASRDQKHSRWANC
ncbi:hypothetical protein ACLOJK_036257 [Asimina triloba]